MSFALIRRDLDLFQDGAAQKLSGSSKKKKSKELMEIISTNKRGVKKAINSVKQNQEKERKAKKKKRLTQKESLASKYKEIDNTEKNLHYLKELSALDATISQNTSKILEQHRGKLAKNRPPEEAPPEEASTVFTDRDFDKFAEEYDW